MATVNRSEFLATLETLRPGLTQQEVVEQSSCFAFKGKRIYTYNEEIACSQVSPIKLTGAVRAAPLLTYLGKLVEEEVEIEVTDEGLKVKGQGGRGCVIKMENDILLPLESIEVPETWNELHENFCEAISTVESCAGKDASQFVATCIHIHPKWIEACDNYQAIRYKIRTGFEKPILARRDSLKHITALAMREFAETDSWLHFRNSSGLVFSCRRSMEEYPDIGFLLQLQGEPMSLPKGLGEAAEKAQIFSSENSDNDEITVELRPGRIRVTGEGASGRAWEPKKVAYDGPELSFNISPKLLTEITQKHTDCEVSQKALRVVGEKFVYVSCLGIKEKKEESDDED